MTPLQALQSTLSGEHAAIYVFAVLGARVSTSSRPELSAALTAGYTTHRGRRDQLTAMLRDAGARPVAAAVSYQLPNAARTPAQIGAASMITETRCAETYAAMVGSTSRADRQFAIDALTDSAVRLLGLGGSPTAFPGAPELSRASGARDRT